MRILPHPDPLWASPVHTQPLWSVVPGVPASQSVYREGSAHTVSLQLLGEKSTVQ